VQVHDAADDAQKSVKLFMAYRGIAPSPPAQPTLAQGDTAILTENDSHDSRIRM
jgi:hypothetical protein